MRLPKFEYFMPEDLKGALDLLSAHREKAAIVAGGTDLLVRMKKGLISPQVLISLKALDELSYIKVEDQLIKIGARTCLADIISSESVQHHARALVTACEKVGAATIQHHRGTLGGNILQNNRCQHYNQSNFHRSGHQPCHKAGGKICYAREVADRCFSTCQSDGATALMALNAKLVIATTQNERIVDLADFYTTDGIKPFAIEPDELLTEIIIPITSGASSYQRLAYRSAIDYPIVCAGVHLLASGAKIDEARIVVGAMGRAPLFLAQASSLLKGKDVTDTKTFQIAADQAKNSAAPFAVHNVGSTLEYRNEMVSPVVLRALNEAAKAVNKSSSS